MEGLCRVLINPGGTTGGVSDSGIEVSVMAEANLQGMIYYIKYFKRIGFTCTHADVDIYSVCSMYPQGNMEESHKDPEVVPTVDPRECPKNLETAEDYIIGFRGVDGQPFSYGLRDILIYLVAAKYTMYRANGSKNFTHYEEMIAH